MSKRIKEIEDSENFSIVIIRRQDKQSGERLCLGPNSGYKRQKSNSSPINTLTIFS